MGAIFGLGFPAFLGGPFRYLDRLGARFAAEVLERLRARHGERFKPARCSWTWRRDGKSFYAMTVGAAGEAQRPRSCSAPPRLAGSHVLLARFGPFLGKRFTRNNLALLGLAHAAYIGLRRCAAAIRGRGANIFTQWVGDPDALGSAVILKAILQELGAKEVRILTGALGHPQNRNLVQSCGIVLHDPNTRAHPRGLNCMVDTSPPLGMSNTGRVEPVPEYFFVADHHADPEDVEANCRARGVRRVKLAYVGLPVGSTSSFMAVLAAAFGVLGRSAPRAAPPPPSASTPTPARSCTAPRPWTSGCSRS